jgi:hypothetical protein
VIHNLRSKLQSLPKSEIKKESPHKDFGCSVFIKEFDAAADDLSPFTSCDISHLKTACKIDNSQNIRPEEIVFFDTETTGLAGGTGTVAFLVGAGRLEEGKLVVRQFLMNDYHQEPSVLEEFKKTLDGAKAVATYNGKSFDAPLIKTRSILNRININLDDFIHFDLLHARRRLYKLRLERMKLTDIEQHILGMEREDDIPGSEIPEIFFNYLKYGESNLLDKVIEHNLNDIVSLAKISGILAQVYASPKEAGCAEDAFCAARTLLKLRRYSQAETVFDALKDDFEDAKRELAYLKRTLGSYNEAINLFDELSEASRFDAIYDIELAKIYEHKMKNYELAVNYALRAKEKAFNNRLLGRESNIIDDIEKRIKRLSSKLEREK